MSGLEITVGDSGGLDQVVDWHRDYYAEHWDFGPVFSDRVRREMTVFLDRFDPARDGFWTAALDGRMVGSVSIDGQDAEGADARLRWFIVDPARHGSGAGRPLLDRALAFCRQAGHRRVNLWTFAGLDAARHLYEAAGFRLIDEKDGDPWGLTVRFQVFEVEL